MFVQRKCYYCGELIENDKEEVMKKIPLATKKGYRNYTRYFHVACVPKFMENREESSRKEERSVWDQVHDYFKLQILELRPSQPMPQHAVRRLLGLRVGKYIPNATNTLSTKQGYSYEVILMTLKICQQVLLQEMSKQRFTDVDHKINFAMIFISKRIPQVQAAVDKREKANKEAGKIQNAEIRRANYVVKGHGKQKFAGLK